MDPDSLKQSLRSFSTPQALPGNESWTADYEGLDQHRNLAYFVISRSDGLRFFVEVDVEGPHRVSDCSFRETVQKELAQHAAAGLPNTTHAGTFATRSRLQKQGWTVESLRKEHSGPFDSDKD